MRPTSALVLAILCASLTGCTLQTTAPPLPLAIPALHGIVHGGQQPVSYSLIQLYATGITGYAGAATQLIPEAPYYLGGQPGCVTSSTQICYPGVETDATGSFNITNDYTCPSPTSQIYIEAIGGGAGLPYGEDNESLRLMAALGTCESLSAATTVNINEVTTVAAVWSLQQFMADDAHIGTSSTNATGLSDAFSLASTLVDTQCGCALQGSIPFAGPYILSPVLPQATINSLADSLAACVNSAGGTANPGDPCALLFAAATPSGGKAPTNTIAAALDIARHPSSNIASVFSVSTADAPFQPTLPSAPADWILSISTVTYAKYLDGATLEPTGGLYLLYCYYSCDFNSGASILVGASSPSYDAAGGLWILGTASGASVSPELFSSAGSVYPASGATSYTFDSNDNIWVNSPSGVNVLSYGGSTLAPTTTGIFANVADPLGNMWGIGASGNLMSSNVSGSTINSTTYTGATASGGLAFDHAGTLWTGTPAGLTQITVSGATDTAKTFAGTGTGSVFAVDGDGNVWTTGSNGPVEYNNSGSLLSPSTGYPIGRYGPDLNGNFWTYSEVPGFDESTYPYFYVTEYLGVGAPTRSISSAASTNTIGTRP